MNFFEKSMHLVGERLHILTPTNTVCPASLLVQILCFFQVFLEILLTFPRYRDIFPGILYKFYNNDRNINHIFKLCEPKYNSYLARIRKTERTGKQQKVGCMKIN